MIVVKILMVTAVIMLLHELGHVISAKLMGLPIIDFGIKSKPYPHLYVSTERPSNDTQRFIYLSAGMISTLIWCVVLWSLGFLSYPFIMWAFILELALEANPFYSDITIALIAIKIRKKGLINPHESEYNRVIKDHQFSIQWYIHFTLWTILVVSLIKYGKLFVSMS
ncbi:hypothetical protein K5X82_11375 [Halosquirtibacter xylanolyticus]|uniref:hypothetical protein n=1 Tax=Halosquirtibacter xylanolyticus TaxID=3374599 RepID=UPI0037479CA9|nr:hypothetical protein K5X82_11375 [Prolixibacteraceae bacterium]